MKKQFASDLAPGMEVDDVFFIADVREQVTPGGTGFCSFRLLDRSGAVAARAREGVRGRIRGEMFARVRGRVGSFRGRPQVEVQAVKLLPGEEQDQRLFIPAGSRDPEEMMGFVDYFVADVYDSDYSRLLRAFFTDQEFRERFRFTPGSQRAHHAYLGGLLEHTVSVATLCQHVVVEHPRLNADLLLTAALLHDIGKIEALACRGRIRLTRRGRLLGHVVLGRRMIEERLVTVDLPSNKELELMHVVVSHHGELEWGAPKRPLSAEALVLHHLDNLDAKVKGYFEVVAGSGELPWPELTNLFRRPLWEPRAADREGR